MKCAYPPCPVMIESGGDNPPRFCEKHASIKCLFAQIGQCDDVVIPDSGWCKIHNAEVRRFDFLHKIRHQEAVQETQRNAAIMQQVTSRGDGNSGGLIRGR